MAADEVLFRDCLAGGAPSVRFYAWDPPGLSLGRYQRNPAGIDPDGCRAAGIPVVRRLTGGRAVLHHHELTYSVAARFEGPFTEGGVVAVYRRLAKGLAAGLALLGVAVVPAGRRKGTDIRPANCFAFPSRCELTWGGRKLVGSAQVRESGGFLQHGSILLDVDADLWRLVFGGQDPARSAVSLREILGREMSMEDLMAPLTEGLARALGLTFVEAPLTPAEVTRVRDLARDRYHEVW